MSRVVIKEASLPYSQKKVQFVLQILSIKLLIVIIIRVFIRHQGSENSLATT